MTPEQMFLLHPHSTFCSTYLMVLVRLELGHRRFNVMFCGDSFCRMTLRIAPIPLNWWSPREWEYVAASLGCAVGSAKGELLPCRGQEDMELLSDWCS